MADVSVWAALGLVTAAELSAHWNGTVKLDPPFCRIVKAMARERNALAKAAARVRAKDAKPRAIGVQRGDWACRGPERVTGESLPHLRSNNWHDEVQRVRELHGLA